MATQRQILAVMKVFIAEGYHMTEQVIRTALDAAEAALTEGDGPMADEKKPSKEKKRSWRCTYCGSTADQFDMPPMNGCTKNKNEVHGWVMKEE